MYMEYSILYLFFILLYGGMQKRNVFNSINFIQFFALSLALVSVCLAK